MVAHLRDEWIRRTGPAYPVFVAYRLQSRLPLAVELQPSAEDVHRARPWLLLVGLGIGALAGGVATVFGNYGGTPAAAAVAIVLSFLLSAGYFEVGLARSVEGAGRWFLKEDDRAVSYLSGPAALIISFFLPFAALLSLPSDQWLGVLVCAHLVARWSCLLADLSVDWRRDIQLGNPPRWMSFAIASVIGAGVVVSLGGANGFLAVLLAGVLALVASAGIRKEPELRESLVAASGCIAGIATYLCFCF